MIKAMSTCRVRRVGHYEGLCFCISSCAQKKRVLCSKCDVNISSNLHSICLRFPSLCVVNLRMNCVSSCDKSRINEYMSNTKGRTYEGLCVGISS